MNITEDNKREPLHITIDFYINENNEWYIVNWIDGQKNLTRIDDLSNEDLALLVINEINDCL